MAKYFLIWSKIYIYRIKMLNRDQVGQIQRRPSKAHHKLLPAKGKKQILKTSRKKMTHYKRRFQLEANLSSEITEA